MIAKRLAGAAALACALASTRAFCPNSAFGCNLLQQSTNGINIFEQSDGRVTMKGPDFFLPTEKGQAQVTDKEN